MSLFDLRTAYLVMGFLYLLMPAIVLIALRGSRSDAAPPKLAPAPPPCRQGCPAARARPVPWLGRVPERRTWRSGGSR